MSGRPAKEMACEFRLGRRPDYTVFLSTGSPANRDHVTAILPTTILDGTFKIYRVYQRDVLQ